MTAACFRREYMALQDDMPIYSPPPPAHPRGALARRRDVGWDRCSSAGTQARSRGSAEEHAVHTDGRASLVKRGRPGLSRGAIVLSGLTKKHRARGRWA